MQISYLCAWRVFVYVRHNPPTIRFHLLKSSWSYLIGLEITFNSSNKFVRIVYCLVFDDSCKKLVDYFFQSDIYTCNMQHLTNHATSELIMLQCWVYSSPWMRLRYITMILNRNKILKSGVNVVFRLRNELVSRKRPRRYYHQFFGIGK